MEILTTEIVAFIAIILGVIGRTYFPFLRKTDEEEGTGVPTVTFDIKYVLTAVFTGIVTAMFIYPMFVFPETTSFLTLFITAFVFAWGANDVVNRLAH